MTRLTIRQTVLGAGALLVGAAVVTACGPATASAPPATSSGPATVTVVKTVTVAPTTASTQDSGSSGNSSKPTAILYTCDAKAESQPDSLALACADNGMNLENLQWTDWGSAKAHATGKLEMHDCDPDCAGSTKFDYYTATATVSGLSGGYYHNIYVVAPSAPNQPYTLPLTGPGGSG